MKRPIILAVMMIALAAAAAAQRPNRQRSVRPNQPLSDWKIEITTDGGITGAGSGGLIVTSDGALVITFGSSPAAKRCSYQLMSDELKTLDSAVKNARPAAWAECYALADISTHCCDLIRTNLSLSARGGRALYLTSWLDVSSALPNDIQTLIELLRGPASLDARYRPLCAMTP